MSYCDLYNLLCVYGWFVLVCGIEYVVQVMVVYGVLFGVYEVCLCVGYFVSVCNVDVFVDWFDIFEQLFIVDVECMSGDGCLVLYGFVLCCGECVLLFGCVVVMFDVLVVGVF